MAKGKRPQSFKTFLRQLKGESSPLGDLASDALNSSNWCGVSAKSLAVVMDSCGACNQAYMHQRKLSTYTWVHSL